MIIKIKELEMKYPVENIIYKNEKIWGFLRLKYYWKTMESVTATYASSQKKSFLTKIIQVFKQSFYGFRNWFKSYEYIVFSDTQERIFINEKYIDKSFECIMDNLGQEKCLYIDLPNPEHIKINFVATKHIVSRRLPNLFITFLIKMTKKRSVDIPLFNKINRENDLDIDYAREIHSFEQSVLFYKLFFKIYKPKAIFVSCYYCNQAIVKAANDMSIQTIEVQHGMIGKEHIAYYPHTYVDKSYFPNILLTFGKYDADIIQKNHFNPFDKIIPIGRYNLELLLNKKIPNDLLELKKKYKRIISISTQYTVEDELAQFVKTLALMDLSIGFIFSLRHFEKEYYEKYQMPSNVFLFKDEYTCYNILKSSDMHMTCYSSCAFEALFFEKPVCLVDINSFSSEYIKMESKNIYKVSRSEEFFKINFRYKKEELDIYTKNHQKQVKIFLKEELNVQENR